MVIGNARKDGVASFLTRFAHKKKVVLYFAKAFRILLKTRVNTILAVLNKIERSFKRDALSTYSASSFIH